MIDRDKEPSGDVLRVWECVNEIACEYLDNRELLQTVFEGVLTWTDREDMIPGIVAHEFLEVLDEWIADRRRRDAGYVKAIREVADENS